MTLGPNITRIAALIADPARALMLHALMDGRALSAGELAGIAGITPQTASSHLAKLVDGGLLALETQGRHRYFRLSGLEAAQLMEAMMEFSGDPAPLVRTGPRDAAMRDARVCYDHLAGAKGVALFDSMVEGGLIIQDGSNVFLNETGRQVINAIGIDTDAIRTKTRPLCRSCLDWSERRPHMAGALGKALLDHMLEKGWTRRVATARTLVFSSEGARQFTSLVSRFRNHQAP